MSIKNIGTTVHLNFLNEREEELKEKFKTIATIIKTSFNTPELDKNLKNNTTISTLLQEISDKIYFGYNPVNSLKIETGRLYQGIKSNEINVLLIRDEIEAIKIEEILTILRDKIKEIEETKAIEDGIKDLIKKLKEIYGYFPETFYYYDAYYYEYIDPYLNFIALISFDTRQSLSEQLNSFEFYTKLNDYYNLIIKKNHQDYIKFLNYIKNNIRLFNEIDRNSDYMLSNFLLKIIKEYGYEYDYEYEYGRSTSLINLVSFLLSKQDEVIIITNYIEFLSDINYKITHKNTTLEKITELLSVLSTSRTIQVLYKDIDNTKFSNELHKKLKGLASYLRINLRKAEITNEELIREIKRVVKDLRDSNKSNYNYIYRLIFSIIEEFNLPIDFLLGIEIRRQMTSSKVPSRLSRRYLSGGENQAKKSKRILKNYKKT